MSPGYPVFRERLSAGPVFPWLLFTDELAIDIILVPRGKKAPAGSIGVLLPFARAAKGKEGRFTVREFAITDGKSQISKMGN